MSVEKKCFSAWDLISSGSSHAGSLFTNEEQKKTVCDVTDASVTHACLVYDISHRLLGTKRQHSWLQFCNFQISVFSKEDEQMIEKNAVCLFLISYLLIGNLPISYFIPIDRAHDVF